MASAASFELRELEIFVAVVRAKSMTGAGRLLGLSQSAISQKIKSLEENLDVVLLDRHARPLRPTPEGDKLFQASQDLLEQSERLAAEVRHDSSYTSSRLSVAIVDSLSGILVPKILKRMGDKVGRWEFIAGLTPVCEHAFSTGKCELSIVAEDRATSQFHVDPYLLIKEPFLKVFPKNYGKDLCDLREASANLRFVRFSLDSTAGRSVEQHVNRLRMQLPLWVESDNPVAQLELIASGTCWGYLTPTFLLSAPHLLDAIQLAPSHEAAFFRRVLLLVRHEQMGDLPNALSEQCRLAFKEDLLPPFFLRFPWTEELIEIPTSAANG